ncbi:MAG: PASTA domain-containing protein [Oscillospiraceae bacterium]|nr:PASTA domain-containing protein [Oscillospiraceae bacterium]
MIIDHDKYEQGALDQQTREMDVISSRGSIVDRNNKVLAISAAVENVYLSPAEYLLNKDGNGKLKEDVYLIARTLGELLDIDEAVILEKYTDYESWYKILARKVEPEITEKIREFIDENDIISVHLENDAKRYYPYGSLACHVIGFVGDENFGLEGLEAGYNSYLTGSSGRIVKLKSSNGVDMLLNDFEEYYDAANGADVKLTIDATIQHYAEKYLDQAIKDYDVLNGGMCIIMNPKTAEIYAMASVEDYDLNDYLTLSEDVQKKIDAITDPEERANAEEEALYTQWRNRAIADTYEPGSVFKILTIAAALETGSVNPDDLFDCQGQLTGIPGREDPLNCWNIAGHGMQNVKESLINSCNCALVQIGFKLGAESFYDFARAFGLFDKTGVDLIGESDSIWWSEEVFFDEDNKSQLASATFGQTFNVTPIQMAAAVCAVVNGGYLMEPYVVQSVTDANGDLVYSHEPQTVRQVISEETSKTMCEYLEAVVSDTAGTSKTAYVAGFRVGGKTGTSENVTLLAETGERQNIASFCGVAPCDDPQVVCLLILDAPNPNSGLYVSGASMAAPTVGQIFSEVLPYLGIEPQYSEEELEYVDITVPNVKRMDVNAAINDLKESNFEVEVVGSGKTVTDQLPSAGKKIASGSCVILYADEKIPQETVEVPDVQKEPYWYAKILLEEAGLYINSQGAPALADYAFVSLQSIAPKTKVERGTVITLTLVDSSTLGNF